MLRRQFSIALLIASASPFFTEVSAASDWQGSYSVDNQCYCSGDFSSSATASLIVPTPVGGQTVKQVCERVGAGPGLTEDNGAFNYPVYKDLQCGNGPFNNARAPRDPDCVGKTDGTYGSCLPAGPRWALAKAYGVSQEVTPEKSETTQLAEKPTEIPAAVELPEIAAAAPTTAKTDDELIAEAQIAKAETSGAETADAEPDEAQTAMKETSTVAEVESAAPEPVAQAPEPAPLTKEERAAVLAGFDGKSVMLGGERYLQARDGLEEEGALLGGRIVMDGQLYLRVDDRLDLADLYQEENQNAETAIAAAPESATQNAATEPVMAAARPVAQTQDTAETQDTQASTEVTVNLSSEETAELVRLEEQQAEREKAARDAYLAEREARKLRLAEQNRKLTESRMADKQNSVQPKARPKQKMVENSDEKALTEASKQAEVKGADGVTQTPSVLTALRLPAGARASSRDFGYIEAMPASYDFGGNGLILEGSLQGNKRFQYMARAGVAESYQEVMVGGGYFVTPAKASRMTVVMFAGIEFGSFELRNDARAPGVTVDSSDSGLFLGLMSRYVVNNKFELKAGVGYSTFFDGDATLSGGAYYHITRQLDFMTRFEIGDNDQLGVGIRYFY